MGIFEFQARISQFCLNHSKGGRKIKKYNWRIGKIIYDRRTFCEWNSQQSNWQSHGQTDGEKCKCLGKSSVKSIQ